MKVLYNPVLPTLVHLTYLAHPMDYILPSDDFGLIT